MTLRTIAHPFGDVLYTRATRVGISRYNTPTHVANYTVIAVPTPSKGLAPRLVGPHLRGFNIYRRSRPGTICVSRISRLKAVCAVRRIGTVTSLLRSCGVCLRVSNTHLTGTYTCLGYSVQRIAISTKISVLDFKKAGGKVVVKRTIISFHPRVARGLRCFEGRSTRLTSGLHCLSYRFVPCLRGSL